MRNYHELLEAMVEAVENLDEAIEIADEIGYGVPFITDLRTTLAIARDTVEMAKSCSDLEKSVAAEAKYLDHLEAIADGISL